MIGDYTPERFEFPEGCEKCPEQCRIGSDFEQLQMLKMFFNNSAQGLIGEEGERMQAAITEHAGGDRVIAEELTTYLKQNTASTLDELDEDIEEVQQESVSLASSCDKPLRMRTTKAGKTYTVAICTSALANYVNSEKPGHKEAHVWVESE